MGTQQLIAIAAVVILVGGGLYFVANKSSNSPTEAVVTSESEKSAAVEESLSGAGPLKTLLGLGRNIQCTFTHTGEQGETSEGTVFVAGSDLRGDFEMTMQGQRIESHIIHDGDLAYTWGETPFGPMAIMFTLDEEDKVDSRDSQSFDFDEEVDYECRSWRVDRSKFTPPSDIEFQNISAEIQQIQAGEAALQGAQCGACDNIPDAGAQAQCRAALGC